MRGAGAAIGRAILRKEASDFERLLGGSIIPRSRGIGGYPATQSRRRRNDPLDDFDRLMREPVGGTPAARVILGRARGVIFRPKVRVITNPQRLPLPRPTRAARPPTVPPVIPPTVEVPRVPPIALPPRSSSPLPAPQPRRSGGSAIPPPGTVAMPPLPGPIRPSGRAPQAGRGVPTAPSRRSIGVLNRPGVLVASTLGSLLRPKPGSRSWPSIATSLLSPSPSSPQPLPAPASSTPAPSAPQPATPPSPLTHVTTQVLPLPRAGSSQCEPCEKGTRRRKRPRPSDTVAKVRVFERRMSQNSLDNLNRGRKKGRR